MLDVQKVLVDLEAIDCGLDFENTIDQLKYSSIDIIHEIQDKDGDDLVCGLEKLKGIISAMAFISTAHSTIRYIANNYDNFSNAAIVGKEVNHGR